MATKRKATIKSDEAIEATQVTEQVADVAPIVENPTSTPSTATESPSVTPTKIVFKNVTKKKQLVTREISAWIRR